jgi:hypothetical protein
MPAVHSKPTLLFNDRIPYLKSEDDGPRMPGGIDQESSDEADLLSGLTMEDVAEISETFTTLPTPIHSTTTATERGTRTTSIRGTFHRIEEQIAGLSRELDLFTDSISLDAFTVIESKYTALHEYLAKQKRKTELLDARKAQLIAQLIALNGRIEATRALLPPPYMRPGLDSNGKVLSLLSIILN